MRRTLKVGNAHYFQALSNSCIELNESPKRRKATNLLRPLPVSLLVAYLLVALNLTSFPWFAKSGSHWGGNHFGWPFTFASAPWTDLQAQEAVEFRLFLHGMAEFTGYISPLLGPWNGDASDFSISRLVANLAICTALTIAAWFVFSRLPINRDGQSSQFSITSLIASVGLLALLTTGLASRYLYFYFMTYRGPILLCILMGLGVVTATLCMRGGATRSNATA